jgi:hypothetical protein
LIVTWLALDAVTVSKEELPETIVVGFAVMLTAGVGTGVTVRVAVAVVLPPGPFAVAVYVVVEVGLTLCVPPLAVGIVYELPSLPVTVTCVELEAVTVRVEELPSVIESGFAVIVTVGGGLSVTVTVALAVTLPEGPDAVAVYVVVFAGLTACVPPLGVRV